MAEKEYRAKDFMTKYVFSVPPNITIHELKRLYDEVCVFCSAEYYDP